MLLQMGSAAKIESTECRGRVAAAHTGPGVLAYLLDRNKLAGRPVSFWRPQESIEKLLAEGRHKAPLKYIESIKLEEFTLGLVPPRFHSCHARYDPVRENILGSSLRDDKQMMVIVTIKRCWSSCARDPPDLQM